ncbi:MAG: hypothetical protein ACQER9_03815 [Nanobdellota archaeon]
MAEKNPARKSEKVINTNVEKEKGYLYYIDEDGDVSRVPAKWNKDPQFLEKVKNDKPKVDAKLMAKKSEIEAKKDLDQEKLPQFLEDKNVVYNDQAVAVTCGDRNLNVGHLRVYSLIEGNIEKIEEDYLIHNATISSVISSIIFEGLKAEGTNIIINEENEVLCTSVIPRFQNDGLNLMWEINQGNQEKIKDDAKKIKDNLVFEEEKDFSKVDIDKNKKVNIIDKEKINGKKPKKNYMIDHLRRTG